MEAIQEGTLLWEPSEQMKQSSNLMDYMNWLRNNRNLDFADYDQLWKWSVEEIEQFWESIWDYFAVISSGNYVKVLSERKMPGAKWFDGTKVNYAEHIFRNKKDGKPAIISKSEGKPVRTMTWEVLQDEVAAFREGLLKEGIKAGDRVAAYIPNIPEAVIAFLACASIGAVWSSCSPDFGSMTVIDRFRQIEPEILIAVDGYRYNGKEFNRLETVKEIQQAIPTVKKTVLLPYLNEKHKDVPLANAVYWDEFVNRTEGAVIDFERVPFDHPLWILFSSGTTGLPKAIVQGHGGILLEHLKQVQLHMDLKEDDRFFWFTTTGWMMWNMVVSGLLSGAAILLYDGSPGYPNLYSLWEFAEETGMTLFGTSASFLLSCKNSNIIPKEKVKLSNLKAIGSTGSPLPPEGFAWVYENVKEDLWLASVSGGTDICSGFVGGSPLLPVCAGEIQCRALGVKVEAFDPDGVSIVDEVGELVVTEPMPSMPIYFWNDKDGNRYKESYFTMYPGVWRHGDWIKITSKGSCQIYGRSDSTINRGGIRMGTSEIYRAVEEAEGVVDSLIVDLSDDKGNNYMPLFVVLEEKAVLDEKMKKEIRDRIRRNCSPRHVPDEIFQVDEIPRTLNGKKLEVPIKKILTGVPVEKAVNKGSLSNPHSIGYFSGFYKNHLAAK